MWNLIYDKTGFPLVQLKNGPAFGVWPVTKIQFERFIAETKGYGDKWYEDACASNPRVSYKHLDVNNYEGLFMSGIKPDDALKYVDWLGKKKEYDIPTVEEWRTFYHSLNGSNIPGDKEWQHFSGLLLQEKPQELIQIELAPTATIIANNISAIYNDALRFTLMKDGFVEWVHYKREFVGLGAPRSEYYSNTFRSLNTMVEGIRLDSVPKFMAFRVIKR
jgi:hypothetical protein